jgi:peptide/nickel transport system substrate-binding protein
MMRNFWAAALGLAVAGAPLLALLHPAGAAETPKRGGTLTYLIRPTRRRPLTATARRPMRRRIRSRPFYSVLIRVNPQNPSSTTDFTCDLCVEMPKPTDGGKTYAFKIRDGVKWHMAPP